MADNEKLDLILSKLEKLEKLDILENDMQELKQQTTNIENRLTSLENRVTNIELILDNEIRVNIQRVAEGHLDLSRNMHDAMKPNNEIEMLAIKVRMLETDVRDLKARLA